MIFKLFILLVVHESGGVLGFGGIFGMGSGVGLYDASKDHVEILNKTNFRSIFSSERAVFVEFYAHWCGACQRYAQHWKELATVTKPWHSKVIRVAAINCGDPSNDEICRAFNIEYYPTLRLFPAQASFDAKDHDSTVIKSDKGDALIAQMINFLEQQKQPKPAAWPSLEPYTSKRLGTMFTQNTNSKFGFLVFESKDSMLGRKLILDFASSVDKVVIRRVTYETNPSLFAKLEVEATRVPVVFLLNNTHNNLEKNYEKFDENVLRKYLDKIGAEGREEEAGGVNWIEAEWKKFSRMIRKFVKIYNLIGGEEESSQTNNKGKNVESVGKKAEAQVYLTSMSNRVFMHDLESALNTMLRSEIPRTRLITGEKMYALKEWMRILVKYFPGRKPVRRYLRNLHNKINSTSVKEITGNQWKIFTEENSVRSNLPDVIEWRHCKGSQPTFRGYPCSLWTLFHVLTVSQVELEKAKPVSFDKFNAEEVIEAIRLYVSNYFGCKECADNFMKETSSYAQSLNKSHDAVIYLWEVHNNVNMRLAREAKESKGAIVQDPAYLKTLFPSKAQCPKCYDQKNAENESQFVQNEALSFIASFYSKYQIEGVAELDALPFKRNNKPKIGHLSEVSGKNEINELVSVDNETKKEKVYDYEDEGDKRLVIESPQLEQNDPNMLKHQSKRLNGIENFEVDSFDQFSAQKTSDIKLSLILVVVVISAFGVLYFYFRFSGKKKLKKHII